MMDESRRASLRRLGAAALGAQAGAGAMLRAALSAPAGAIGVGTAGALAGCGRSNAGVTTLDFWAMGREAEVVRELVPAFTQRHRGIAVKVQQLPWTVAHEKLLTAFAGGALPDLCQLGNTWIPEFTALDALVPLDARIAASRVVQLDDYYPGILDTNRMPGKGLQALPWYVDTRLLFYRTDLLQAAGVQRPPRDWQEWRTAMAAVKRHVGPNRSAALLPLNEPEPLLALALQQGAILSPDDTRGAFAGEPFRRALGFYAEAFAQGWAPAMTASQVANVYEEFARGTFTFYITGPWNIGEFRRRLPAAVQGAWAAAPLPGPDGPGVSTAGGSSLVMFRRSKRQDAAWSFIEYLNEPAVQQRLHALTGDLPPRRSAWAAPALANDPPSQAFAQQLERLRPTPKIPEWERIVQEMQAGAERVVRGRQTIDAATRDLDQWTDRVLDKRRWLLMKAAQSAR